MAAIGNSHIQFGSAAEEIAYTRYLYDHWFPGRNQKTYGRATNCKASLDCDEVWTPDNIYIIFGTFNTGEYRLTIEAGTWVIFEDDLLAGTRKPPGTLLVDGGELLVKGTAQYPVVFSAPDVPDHFWAGVHLQTFRSARMEHLIILSGGRGGGSFPIDIAPDSSMDTPSQPVVELHHVDLYRCGTKALKIASINGISADSTVTIHSYWEGGPPSSQLPAVICYPSTLASFTKDNLQFAPRVPEKARLISLSVNECWTPVHIRNLGVPIDVGSLALPHRSYSGEPLVCKIEPGVVLHCSEMIAVGFHDTCAALQAIGTTEQPILFTARPEGMWGGIIFSADATLSELKHCIFQDASGGGAMWHDADRLSEGAMISVMNPPRNGEYGGPKLTHCTFKNTRGSYSAIRARTMASYMLQNDYQHPSYANVFEGWPDSDHIQLPPHGGQGYSGGPALKKFRVGVRVKIFWGAWYHGVISKELPDNRYELTLDDGRIEEYTESAFQIE